MVFLSTILKLKNLNISKNTLKTRKFVSQVNTGIKNRFLSKIINFYVILINNAMSFVKSVKETNLGTERTDVEFEETDKPIKRKHVSYLDLAVLLYSIIFHFVDVGYDLYVVHRYFITGKFSYFAWTLGFILIPSVVMTSISVKMYIDDGKSSGNFNFAIVRISLCVLGLIFQSASLIRYCDAFWYAIKSLIAKWQSDKTKEERYFTKMSNEDSDVALLKVFECYSESAPQQVLQLTFLMLEHNGHTNVHKTNQLVVLTLSFMLMGACMTNYHRCIRYDQQDKQKMSASGLIVQFLWHMNFTVSRILAISALAIISPFWTVIAVVCHWCSMTIWVAVCSKTAFCGDNKISEVFFACAIGLVYIFNFISLRDGPTRKSYLIYYLLCFVENVITTLIWSFLAAPFKDSWIYYIFAVLPVLTCILGIVFLIIYYQFLHPNLQKVS